jgi:hypothetical protein
MHPHINKKKVQLKCQKNVVKENSCRSVPMAVFELIQLNVVPTGYFLIIVSGLP